MFPIIVTLEELMIYSGRSDYLLATGSPSVNEVLQQEEQRQRENQGN